jgi:hypothetical protein
MLRGVRLVVGYRVSRQSELLDPLRRDRYAASKHADQLPTYAAQQHRREKASTPPLRKPENSIFIYYNNKGCPLYLIKHHTIKAYGGVEV